MIEKELFDLILLDLMLPGKNGYEICREIRNQIDIPILMVTARTESVDKIRGLGLGADDYIAKPFDPAELVARVHANLRQYERVYKKIPKEESEEPEEIQIHDLRILVNSWKVYEGEREIKFPNREFEILKFFAMNPNIVFSKEQIFEKIWGYDTETNQNVVWVYVSYLRKKLAALDANVAIKAVRNRGYALEAVND